MNPTATRWPSQRNLSAIYAFAIGILVTNVLFTAWKFLSISADTKGVNRTQDIVAVLGDIRAHLLRAEVSQVAFLFTRDEGHLSPYDRSIEATNKSMARLAPRVGDDATRRAHIKAIEQVVAGRIAEMAGSIRARKEGGPAALKPGRAHGLMGGVERQLAVMEAEETKVRRSLKAGLSTSFWWTIYAFLLVSALDLILLLAVHYLNYLSRKELTINAEWLSTTLRSIGDAVIATDSAGRVSFMNGIAEGLTGWRESEASGIPLDQVFVVIDEATREPADHPVGRVLTTGAIQGLVEHAILIDRDGAERPIYQGAAPIRDHGGTIHGVVMVFRDVTRDRADRSERDQLYRELSEKDRRKDEFLAMLAHELRNPLAAIGNAVMLSSSSEMRDHLEWSLDVIRRQMRHLSRMIDDLLDVSRISRGKIELRRDRVDAGVILENAIETVRPLIDERNHLLEVSIDAGGLWTDADPTRLEQILVNLLINAAKYTQKGGKIAVSGRIEGDSVTVSVADTGVGIAPGKLPQMFELFVQGDRSLARSEGGLGIGLTVVKKLVEMHGGGITARSEGLGKGSEFTISLVAAAAPMSHDSADGEVAHHPGPSRVLVVDDNVDTVVAISKILTFLGHEVAVAYSGPEGIEAARRARPDFILLDIVLPGMDGYEVARQLKGEDCCRNSVIIGITGYGLDDDRHGSTDSGFDHHMAKPLDRDTLVTLLSKN